MFFVFILLFLFILTGIILLEVLLNFFLALKVNRHFKSKQS